MVVNRCWLMLFPILDATHQREDVKLRHSTGAFNRRVHIITQKTRSPQQSIYFPGKTDTPLVYRGLARPSVLLPSSREQAVEGFYDGTVLSYDFTPVLGRRGRGLPSVLTILKRPIPPLRTGRPGAAEETWR
jgi:hypothetical protein